MELLVLVVALTQVVGVPRESPDFDPELHVPDMSSSEEVPQEDRRESEKGCHWTSRLKMELCGGDGCHESEILAFDFQRRAWEYYEAGKMMAHSERRRHRLWKKLP